jgi:hypothetical protein
LRSENARSPINLGRVEHGLLGGSCLLRRHST